MTSLPYVVAALFSLSAPAPQDARTRAAAAFADGDAKFSAADYEGALAAFERAYALAPHDKVRFNIGKCLEALGRHREAFVAFDAAAQSPQLTAADRSRARAAADRSAKELGRLSFAGVSGIDVQVDDQLSCTSPCTIDLDPGTHQVVVGAQAPASVEVRRAETTAVPLRAPAEADPADEPTPARGPEGARVHAPPPVVPPGTPVGEDRPVRREPDGKLRPGPLTWVGVSLGAVGGAGILGFGLRARALHGDYVASPSEDLRQRGTLMRNLANASIGVAGAGALLVVGDLVRAAIVRRRG